MPGVIVPQAREKKDPLTTVMQGLQIAQSVYGIKSNMEDREQKDQDRAKSEATEADVKRGVMTPMQRLSMQKDFEEVPEGTAGAVPAYVRDQSGTESPLFLKARGKFAPKKTELTKVETLRDGKPGHLVKYSDGTEEFFAGVPKDAPPDKSNENAMGLRKEYQGLPTTQDTSKILSAHSKVSKAASTAKPTAATDMSLVYGYMKLLDPGSAVKEGEYANAEKARGVPDWVIGLYNKAKDGQILSPEQRAAFGNEADSILEGQLALQAEQDDRYSGYARQFKVDPVMIVDPTFAKATEALAKRRAPAPTKQSPAEKVASAPAAPKVGEERDGYIFKGGDPAKEENWTKGGGATAQKKPAFIGTRQSILGE